MGSVYLAIRYLRHERLKTTTLVLSLALAIFLPLATHRMLALFEQEWRSRAASTPLIIGARGSRFDLVLHCLYFRGTPPGTIPAGEADKIGRSGLATALPLYRPATARNLPVVGITLEYLDFRGLAVARGTGLATLGDCLLGAEAARRLALAPDDRLLTDPENPFDIAGAYPLNLRVAGILTPTGTPDDEAVFIDLKTAWVISGLAHGHEDLSRAAPERILERRGNEYVGNAAVVEYTTITSDNIASFHIHGDPATMPLTGIVVVPRDQKAATMLRGRYVSPDSTVQVLQPPEVIDELIALILRVRTLFDVILGAVVLILALYIALVVSLSLRLRREEMETMRLMGCSRRTVWLLHLAEYGLILAGALLLAVLAVLLTQDAGADALRRIIFKGA